MRLREIAAASDTSPALNEKKNQPTNKIMSVQFVIKFGKVRIIIEYKF